MSITLRCRATTTTYFHGLGHFSQIDGTIPTHYITIPAYSQAKMTTSLLSNFFHDDLHTFIQRVIRKMTYGDSSLLHKWGDAILRSKNDPAKELLQALIFADAPRILAQIIESGNDMLYHIFIDWDVTDETTDLDQFVDFIDSINYDEDDYPQSTALKHLANYIRGDLTAATPLLYAITNRIWRNMGAYNNTNLFAATFVLHTYLFHFCGWSPCVDDEPVGVLHDRRVQLAGKDHSMATQREWEDFAVTPHYGLPQFSVLPRVTRKMMVQHGVHIAQTVCVQFRFHTLVFADCGDDGVALITQFEGRDVAYFLTWNGDDYEEAIHYFFKTKQDETDTQPIEEELDVLFHSI